MKKKRNPLPAHSKAPIAQPGGEELSKIALLIMKWTSGRAESGEVIQRIGEVVGESEYFGVVLKSMRWKREGK